jgi:hypothetical protein
MQEEMVLCSGHTSDVPLTTHEHALGCVVLRHRLLGLEALSVKTTGLVVAPFDYILNKVLAL